MNRCKNIILIIFIVGVVITGYLWDQSVTRQIQKQQQEIEYLHHQLEQSSQELDSLQQLQAKIDCVLQLIRSLDKTKCVYLCGQETRLQIARAIVRHGDAKHYSLYVSLIAVESQGRPNVVNGKCIGLFQINTKYHRAPNLNTVDGNIRVGCNLIDHLHEQKISALIAKFNGGYNPQYIVLVKRIKSIAEMGVRNG